MKKHFLCFLVLVSSLLLTACEPDFSAFKFGPAEPEPEVQTVELSAVQMKAICDLATLECYYHNVAKYSEEDAEGFLFWKKDKTFWVEYGGTITMGIDASKVNMTVEGDVVTITMPQAKVLSSHVDKESLTEDSFIVAFDSAKITAEDTTLAYKEAQEHMEEIAANDGTLLANAQQRAQKLLEDYVNNIGEQADKHYTIKWEYVKEDKKPSTK